MGAAHMATQAAPKSSLPDTAALEALKSADPASLDMTMLDALRLKIAEAKEQLGADPEPSDGNDGPDVSDNPQIAQLNAAEEAVEHLQQEQTRRLNDMAAQQMKDFEDAVKAKKDVESRMIDDERQYDGKQRVRNSKAYSTDAGDAFDTNDMDAPIIHATRSRTQLYTARLVDMMLPTHDIPFRVDSATNPDPDCFPQEVLQGILQAAQGAAQQGQPQLPQQGAPQAQGAAQPQPGPQQAPSQAPPPPADGKALLQQVCDAAASKLQDTIRDQLFEQGLQKHGRKCIGDGCRVGYGIVKGPFAAYRRHRKAVGPKSEVVVEERPVPGLDYVNPWLFYYDMMPTLEESSKCWEVHLYDRRKMMDLKRYPRVIAENIDELLDEKEPSLPPALSASLTMRNKALDSQETTKGRWAVIEFHGVIDPDKLKETMGIEWEDENSLPLIEFWFCNGKAIKWKLSPLECDWRVPYYNFTPFPMDDTIFGASVPYLARSSQKVVDASWDATLTNASCAAGPFLFFKKSVFQPMDERWKVRGPTTFNTVSDLDGPISDAFSSLTIDSNVEGNLELVQRGLDLMDQDTLLNQILQGDISKAGDGTPASALVQMINLSTIVQRMLAAGADDHWFQPMAERWGWWNQLYNPDPGVKGDFEYRGIASSTLVSRDIQVQHTQVLTALAGDPRFSGFCDDYDLFEINTRLLDIPNKDTVLKDKQAAMAAHAAIQAASVPPEVALQQKKLDLEAQSLSLKEREVEYAHQERMAEIAREQAKDQDDAQLKKADIDAKVLVANAQIQVAFAGLAAKKDVDTAQLMLQIQEASRSDAMDKFLAAMDLTKATRTEAMKTEREIGKAKITQQNARENRAHQQQIAAQQPKVNGAQSPDA